MSPVGLCVYSIINKSESESAILIITTENLSSHKIWPPAFQKIPPRDKTDMTSRPKSKQMHILYLRVVKSINQAAATNSSNRAILNSRLVHAL